MYILSKVFKLLKKYRVLYFLISLQIVVGMSIFLYSDSYLNNISKLESDLKNIIYSDYIELVSDNSDESVDMSIDDYNQINKLTGNKISIIKKVNANTVFKNKVIDYDIYFVDFDRLSLDKNSIYCNSDLKESILGGQAITNVNIENFKIVNNENISFDKIGIVKNCKLFYTLDEIKSGLLVDLGKFETVINEDEDNSNSISTIFIEKSVPNSCKERVHKYLKLKYKDSADVVLNSIYGNINSTLYTSKVNFKSIRNIGILLFLSLIVCYIIIYIKIVNDRKFITGISLVCGASYLSIFLEMLMEIFFIFFSSSMISTIIAIILVLKVDHSASGVINSAFNYGILVLPTIVSLLISIFLTLVSFYEFSKNELIELINNGN